MFRLLIFFFVVCVSSEEPVTDIPSYLRSYVCTRSNPDYAKCTKNSLENCWGYFVQGIKEMNIPPVDPLLISLFEFTRNITRDFAIDLSMRNLWIYGAKDLQFQTVNVGPYKLKIQMSLLLPNMRVRTQYEVDASVGQRPVVLQGFIDANFSDVSLVPKLSVKKYEKNGTDYFAVDNFDLKFNIGNGHIYLSGSTEEEEVTAGFFTRFFNEDPRGVLKTVTPALTQHMNKVITDGLNRFFSHLPASKLQPE